MPIQIRIVAVIAAAVMTAAAHHRFLENRLQTAAFVATTRPLPVGTKVDAADLTKIELSGNLHVLSRQFLPWKERGVFFATPLYRAYDGGELVTRREAEQRVLDTYQPKPNEHVLIIELPNTTGLKNNFRIGSAVGFYIATSSDAFSEDQIEECGPFTLRQLGKISKQVDPSIMGKLSPRTVTLSLPKAPGGAFPARAQKLLNAVNGSHNSRIVGLYSHSTS